jgi:hypothetical protein
MSFEDIRAWATELGLETEYDEKTHRYRFRSPAELLGLGEKAVEVDTEWMTHFEAEEFLQELDSDLETQPE